MNAPTLIPWLPEAEGQVVRYAHDTSVIEARNGTETRTRVRATPTREVRYRYRLLSEDWRLGFPSLWLSAAEPLRVYLPLWFNATRATADVVAGASTIMVATADRGYVDGGYALLWRSPSVCEVVPVQTVAADSLTLTAPVVGDYPSANCVVAPVIIAWMDPPEIEQHLPTGEDAQVTFWEETPVAGVDAAVGAGQSAVPVSMTIWSPDGLSGFIPNRWVLRAEVLDAAGVRLPNMAVTWVLNPTHIGLLGKAVVTSIAPQLAVVIHDQLSSNDIGVIATVVGFPAVTAAAGWPTQGTAWDHL